MKRTYLWLFIILVLAACNNQNDDSAESQTQEPTASAQFFDDANRFADLQILEYEVGGLD